MQPPLFDSGARKQTVSLTVNGDRYAGTRALGINASRVAEAALAQALHERQRELLRTEIHQDMAALADYVAAHGDPAAELREMFDAPDAA
jgi:post-segregation antitoxin (ccd killing protein)